MDEARQHIPLLKMLKQFHYIDLNGKDQGVNVRNRAQELAKLLGDVDAIRGERKKARSNRNKFRGVEGGSSAGAFNSSSQYGGFGSETNTYGGYSGEVYGDGGGYGGRETDFSDTQRRGETFEEYDEETEGTAPARTPVSRTATRTTVTSSKRETKPKQPEQDLFDFADEPAQPSAATRPTNVLEDISNTNTADDDFDDFQSATSPAVTSSGLASLSPPPAATARTTFATQFGAPKPVPPAQQQTSQSLFNIQSPSSIPSTVSSPPLVSSIPLQAPKPTGYQPSGPNYFTSVPTSINNSSVTSPGSAFSKPGFSSNSTTSGYGASTRAATLGKPEAKASTGSSGDAFGSLWSTASADAGLQNRAGTPGKGTDLASLAKERSNASFWGASGGSSTPGGPRSGATAPTPNAGMGQNRPGGAATPSLGNGLDDLLG